MYFAAFHLVSALLASDSVEVKLHRGLHSVLGLQFVKMGRLEPRHQQTLARLETWRDKADYDRGFVADATLFDREWEAFEQLRAAVEAHLSSAGLTVPPA